MAYDKLSHGVIKKRTPEDGYPVPKGWCNRMRLAEEKKTGGAPLCQLFL